MSFRPVASLLAVALALPLSACTPPRGAAVVDCTVRPQLALNAWTDCTVRVDAFHGPASASLRSRSPAHYRHFEAEGDFTVERGRVRVTVRGRGEPVVFTVAPGQPWHGRVVSQLVAAQRDRDDRAFTIALEPEGEASGFHATLRYRGTRHPMKAAATTRSAARTPQE